MKRAPAVEKVTADCTELAVAISAGAEDEVGKSGGIEQKSERVLFRTSAFSLSVDAYVVVGPGEGIVRLGRLLFFLRYIRCSVFQGLTDKFFMS